MSRRARRGCEENHLEKEEFYADLNTLAEESIRDFFGNKSWYCGGPIPNEELEADWAVKTVLLTQFDDVVFDYIHDECLVKIPEDPKYSDPSVPWTVHILLGLLSELKSHGISKDFQPGLLLLYFKLCRGIEIPPPPLL